MRAPISNGMLLGIGFAIGVSVMVCVALVLEYGTLVGLRH